LKIETLNKAEGICPIEEPEPDPKIPKTVGVELSPYSGIL
jgi:hypothetical protein